MELDTPASVVSANLADAFAALARGDVDALGAIFDAAGRAMYAVALWRTGSATDADDVVQEAFVRLARNRSRLDDVKDPLAYVLAMTHRLGVDVYRARRRRAECALEPAYAVPSADAGPQLEAQRLSRAMAALAPAQRVAVGLHVLYGMTYREVARATGVPLFTAASRVRLGLSRLRVSMEAHHEPT